MAMVSGYGLLVLILILLAALIIGAVLVAAIVFGIIMIVKSSNKKEVEETVEFGS